MPARPRPWTGLAGVWRPPAPSSDRLPRAMAVESKQRAGRREQHEHDRSRLSGRPAHLAPLYIAALVDHDPSGHGARCLMSSRTHGVLFTFRERQGAGVGPAAWPTDTLACLICAFYRILGNYVRALLQIKLV